MPHLSSVLPTIAALVLRQINLTISGQIFKHHSNMKALKSRLLRSEALPVQFLRHYLYHITKMLMWNKKVLLREHKRHTARRVASAHSAAVSWPGGGYPHPVLIGGGGTPSIPDHGGVYPHPVPIGGGARYPLISQMGISPPPSARWGYPPLARWG